MVGEGGLAATGRPLKDAELYLVELLCLANRRLERRDLDLASREEQCVVTVAPFENELRKGVVELHRRSVAVAATVAL